MSKRKVIVGIILIILILIIFAVIRFASKVQTIEAVIVKVYNQNYLLVQKSDGELFNIGRGYFNNKEFKEGQEIKVFFTGGILEIYPEQLNKELYVKILKEKSDIEITDSTKRYLSKAENVDISVKEISNKVLKLLISDKNEYKYSYPSDYEILKEIENDNYEKLEKIDNSLSEESITIVKNKDIQENTVDWSSIYGELPEGKYKITFTDSKATISTITVIFTVDSDGEAVSEKCYFFESNY